MNQREAKRQEQRTQSNKEELVERIARALPEDGAVDVFPDLRLARSSKPKVLAPLITREIVFRLLAGGQGARLSHLLASGSVAVSETITTTGGAPSSYSKAKRNGLEGFRRGQY
jgi:hypothetical protein